jgi:hypothetical protein
MTELITAVPRIKASLPRFIFVISPPPPSVSSVDHSALAQRKTRNVRDYCGFRATANDCFGFYQMVRVYLRSPISSSTMRIKSLAKREGVG